MCVCVCVRVRCVCERERDGGMRVSKNVWSVCERQREARAEARHSTIRVAAPGLRSAMRAKTSRADHRPSCYTLACLRRKSWCAHASGGAERSCRREWKAMEGDGRGMDGVGRCLRYLGARDRSEHVRGPAEVFEQVDIVVGAHLQHGVIPAEGDGRRRKAMEADGRPWKLLEAAWRRTGSRSEPRARRLVPCSGWP